jgi:hypothetical protein
MRIVLTALLALASWSVAAQVSCQKIGQQVFCSNGTTSQQIGDSTFYNYPNQQRAQQQGLPSSSTQIGNTRFYDNGTTATDIGNTRFYSNGTTRQSIGNTDFYSNGKTCQKIGNQVFCN